MAGDQIESLNQRLDQAGGSAGQGSRLGFHTGVILPLNSTDPEPWAVESNHE